MFNIRGWEWIILLVIVILIFGPSKIPDLARSVGKAVTEFRKGIKGAKEELENVPKDIADVEEEPKNT
jgi:sec-independent protein translocase protein TatA